jgi:hypothetical protein
MNAPTPRRRPVLATALACALALAGCATYRADAPVLPLARLEQAAVPGQGSRAEILAALGPATRVRFDSGMEVWMYRYRAGDGDAAHGGEFVLLFGADGLLKKVRRGPVWSPPAPS